MSKRKKTFDKTNQRNGTNVEKILTEAWTLYFPQDSDEFDPKEDGRVQVVMMFREFLSHEGARLIQHVDLTDSTLAAIYINYQDLIESCSAVMGEIQTCLKEQAQTVLSCIGVAIHLIRTDQLEHHQSILNRGNIASTKVNTLPKVNIRISVGGFSGISNNNLATSLTNLKANVVNQFVSVTGTIVRVSSIKPLVTKCNFLCIRCGTSVPTFLEDGYFEPPISCPGVSLFGGGGTGGQNCRSRSFVPDRSSATTVDFQTIKLQEVENDDADPGRIPRTVEVELLEDLVDTCIPGDLVTVTGVVRSVNSELYVGRSSKRAQSNTLHILYIKANSVENAKALPTDTKGEKLATVQFSKQDLLEIQDILSCVDSDNIDDGNCTLFQLLVHSLCPGIYGNEIVKAGLLLGLFGGTSQNRNSIVSPRSDSHILVVGDPGLGKSQMLRAVSMVAPRSVFICGNTTTTTGLTVTMVKDTNGDYALEAGALVLADQGICCIDEFDKMGIDYQALLEAMEQQSISIAKAGIVTNLSARTSVIAAANPTHGHYNKAKSVAQNLKIKPALLSRFDLIFVLLDRPDVNRDQLLSAHIMNLHGINQDKTNHKRIKLNHSKSSYSPCDNKHGNSSVTLTEKLRSFNPKNPLIPQPILRKYIAYAKMYIHPKLSGPAAEYLQQMYLQMRKTAGLDMSDGGNDTLPITTRQLQSLIRLAQARAKLEFRQVVTLEDAKNVVEIMQHSLLDILTNESGELDFGRSGGMSLAKKVKKYVARLMKTARSQEKKMFSFHELLEVANSMGLAIDDFGEFIEILRNECYILKKGPKMYQVQLSISSYSQLR